MLNNVLILLASITISSTAHVLLKKGTMTHEALHIAAGLRNLWMLATNGWVVGGLFLHVTALAVWLLALTRVDVTYAYPFLALGYLLVSVMAFFWFGEHISPQRVLGMAVIVLGLVILSTSEQMTS